MQQFQTDLAGFLPEAGVMPRRGAGFRMPSHGLALFPELPPGAEVLARLLPRLLAPEGLIEGVDHRLQRLMAHPAAGAGFVMVLPPLGNLSSRHYRVHPRRNDRVVAVAPELVAQFPAVDFLRFDFTGHMLSTLKAADSEAFARLQADLHRIWSERLRRLWPLLPPQGVVIRQPGDPTLDMPAHLRSLTLDPAASLASALPLLSEALLQ